VCVCAVGYYSWCWLWLGILVMEFIVTLGVFGPMFEYKVYIPARVCEHVLANTNFA
jgi:hypothetical protein